MGAVAPSRTGAGRGAAGIRVVGASLENELWQSQELVQVELPPGGFVVLKPAAEAASANGAWANQRIMFCIFSDIHLHSKMPRETEEVKVYDFSFTCKPLRVRHRMLQ